MTDIHDEITHLMARFSELVESYRAIPPMDDTTTLDVLYNRLLEVRGYMSSLSAVLSSCYLLRGRAQVSLSVAKGKLETQESEVVSAGKSFSTDFLSGHERRANLRSKTLEAEVEVRKRQETLDAVTALLEAVRVEHRDMDRSVWDIDLIFKILNSSAM